MNPTLPQTATDEVVVYSKPNCVQCDATKLWLTSRGIEFTVDDLTDEGNLAAAKFLGHMQAPVVVNGEHNWSGHHPGELDALKLRLERLRDAA